MTSVPTTPKTDRIETDFVVGRSVQDRPITLYLFGNRDGFDENLNLKPNIQPILILGGTHGNEPGSAALARQLIDTLKKHPEIYQNRYLAILPEVNPDGLAANTRVNANKIDLNRNFPAKNWKKTRKNNYYGGSKPNSEPETQTQVTIIENLKPCRILTIHSITKGKHGNNYDGPAAQYAQVLCEQNSYKLLKTMGYPTPGSLGSWAGIERNIPIVTLELPRGQNPDQNWKENETALLAFIRCD
jgi:protein MpaA